MIPPSSAPSSTEVANSLEKQGTSGLESTSTENLKPGEEQPAEQTSTPSSPSSNTPGNDQVITPTLTEENEEKKKAPEHVSEKAKLTFVCTLCSKEFGTKGSLKTHTRVHTGERPFVCPIDGCGKSFTQHANCTRHVKLMHSDEGKKKRTRRMKAHGSSNGSEQDDTLGSSSSSSSMTMLFSKNHQQPVLPHQSVTQTSSPAKQFLDVANKKPKMLSTAGIPLATATIPAQYYHHPVAAHQFGYQVPQMYVQNMFAPHQQQQQQYEYIGYPSGYSFIPRGPGGGGYIAADLNGNFLVDTSLQHQQQPQPTPSFFPSQVAWAQAMQAQTAAATANTINLATTAGKPENLGFQCFQPGLNLEQRRL